MTTSSDEGPIGPFRGRWWFLSNFSWSEVVYDGERYRTVEHAYQAAKTLDRADHRLIARLHNASQAKRYGKTLTLRPGWAGMKREVMLGLLRQKFVQPKLGRLLQETGDRELVEYNTWGDTYWGVCNGRGQNWLGRLLMQVREELRAEPW